VELEEAGRIHEAIRVYTAAARLGDEIAQNNLATLLDDRAIPRRPAEAVYWYKRAVRAGSAEAAWNLAMHYRNLGKRRWQIHWLRVAARLGEPDAPVALREMIHA